MEVDLPKKKEYILYAPLSEKQAGLYKATLDRDLQSYLEKQNDISLTHDKPVVIDGTAFM